jgi:hypothetical protein
MRTGPAALPIVGSSGSNVFARVDFQIELSVALGKPNEERAPIPSLKA